MKHILVIFILLFSMKGFSGVISIKSNPSDCDVFQIDPISGKKSALGKTPYKADLDTLKGESEDNATIQLSIYKPGFDSFNVTVPSLGNVDVNLNANLEVQKDIKMTQDLDMMVTDLFDVLRMMRIKDFPNASKKLFLLEKKFPHYSIIHEMKGTVSYLQKEFKQSLNYYRKAFGINPKNREAYKMKVYLEKKFKIKE